MKQTEQVGCGLSIKMGCIFLVILISFSIALADENTTTTSESTTTVETTTIETTTTVDTTTTIDENQTTTTTTSTTTTINDTNETIDTYITVLYDSDIEEGETSLIKVSYTWDNGTVVGASGTIEFNGESGETYDLIFNESSETYDYSFSESEGNYSFYITISKESFQPQFFNGSIEVSPPETTSTTSTTSTTTTYTTTTVDDYSTSLHVTASTSIYSNETAEFKINYTKGDVPVREASVILTISHEEINLITNGSYMYSETYLVPWSSSGFYYYSLSLEPSIYNYSITASKNNLETKVYKGEIRVMASSEDEGTDQYFIDAENLNTENINAENLLDSPDDEIPEESLKASLPVENSQYSEIFVIFILFGFMCTEVSTIVFMVYRNMKREEETVTFLLFLMASNSDEGGLFGDLI